MNAERPIADAVTAVLIHQGEVFVAQRNVELPAFPGYLAFPGGKVEAEDSNGGLEGGAFSNFSPRLIRALSRELDEELGFNFIQAYRDRQIEAVAQLGQATTPAFAPIRFRTWFFRIDLKRRLEFTLDTREHSNGYWQKPKQLLASFERGELLMVPPTVAVLRKLDALPDAQKVPRLNFSFDAEQEIPCIEPLGGLKIFLVRSNTLPPADRTNCFYLGDAEAPKVLVDPSPKDEAEYQRLLQTIEPQGVDAILLTHHHQDHCERADDLARHWQVPVWMSADTRDRLSIRRRGAFLRGIKTRLLSEGDEVTRWQNQPVTVLEVPGHDRGQLALMPESRAWCIVGDLIQGIGTVVIAPPEGDMRQYFASMKRVIRLEPAVIVPSHGPAMGSVYRLRTALAHREARESAIFDAWMNGDDEQQMLAKLYAGIDPRLLPLALINIRSHMKKLREEGRVNS